MAQRSPLPVRDLALNFSKDLGQSRASPLPTSSTILRPSTRHRPGLARQLAVSCGGSRGPLAEYFGPKHRPRWAQRLAQEGLACASGETLARDERMARLEAILFLAREVVSTRKLAQLAGLADGTEARTLVRRLNRWYDAAGCAFRAEELAGGFRLMTRAKFGSWLRRSLGAPAEVRLSGPALETLAVVAYRQPVLRAQIEAIRGVDCGEILRQLMDRDLVRTAGRADELGRPYRYATTRRFLQVFGLRHLDDLPRAHLLRPPDAPAGGPREQTGSFSSPTQPSHDSGIQANSTQPNTSEDEEDS